MAMGGVGEAAMLGAVMGGGSAMLTGGDPLKGAMMGGLTGGIGGAAGPALSSLTAPTTAATLAPAVSSMAPEIAASTLASTATNPATALSLNLTPSTTLLNSPMPFSAGTNFLEVPGVTNLNTTSFGSSLGQISTGTGGIANIPTNLPIAAPATFASSAAVAPSGVAPTSMSR